MKPSDFERKTQLSLEIAKDDFSIFGGMEVGGGGCGGGGGSRGMRMRGSWVSRSFGGMFGDDNFSSVGESRPMNQSTCKAPPIENTLSYSLEELYKGTAKKMKIAKEIADARG